MKCPKCEKNWGITMGKYYHCFGCGEETMLPMTNEEWFCGLTTEEKGEWIINYGFSPCSLRNCANCKYYDKKNDDCDDYTDHKEMWVEWLKQPHKE